jgi:uncharacterized protein YkwD
MRILNILAMASITATAGCVVAVPGGGGMGLDAVQVNAVEDMSFAQILNTYRATTSLGPVTYNAQLNQAAQDYADLLGANPGYIAQEIAAGRDPHIGPDGSTTFQRIQASGYPGTSYGENLATRQSTEQEVLDDWIDSPSHRTVLQAAPLDEFGLGLNVNSVESNWVLVMGAQ